VRISGDLTKCIGAGQCVMMAPELFTQDEETGLVVVLVPHPDAALRDAALAAEMACPTRAVTVDED